MCQTLVKNWVSDSGFGNPQTLRFCTPQLSYIYWMTFKFRNTLDFSYDEAPLGSGHYLRQGAVQIGGGAKILVQAN